MALQLPSTAKEISQKAKVDVKRELAQSDPFVARSYLGAIISGISNRVFEFYAALVAAEVEANPFTAVRNLVRWASVWGVTRLSGQTASGFFFVDSSQTGLGVTINVGTAMVSSDGLAYTTQSKVKLATGSIGLSGSLTQSGGVAFVTTASDHLLASNALVTITGASPTAYNIVDAPITVTGSDTFTYEVNSATASPATGTPVFGYSGATIPVNSDASGDTSNLSADAELNFVVPIASVEAGGQVTFDEVTNGIDVESDDDLRKRLLDRIQNPVTPFNVAGITAKAREVSGVTRVFVQEEHPLAGQVTIYFMRDNDVSPIPVTDDVTETKAKIITIKPANVADSDVIVTAPIGAVTDFTFSSIVPDTETMRDAITATLDDYFSQVPEPELNIVEDAYRSVIFNTVDPATGNRVTQFTLTGPQRPVNGGDETTYDNSPASEGVFVGGTGHNAADVITLADGTTITVDVEVGNVVTEFTVGSAASRGNVADVTIIQESSTGAGIDFTLTPGVDNQELMADLVVGTDGIRIGGSVAFS